MPNITPLAVRYERGRAGFRLEAETGPIPSRPAEGISTHAGSPESSQSEKKNPSMMMKRSRHRQAVRHLTNRS
jgi:hypothetical protein